MLADYTVLHAERYSAEEYNAHIDDIHNYKKELAKYGLVVVPGTRERLNNIQRAIKFLEEAIQEHCRTWRRHLRNTKKED